MIHAQSNRFGTVLFENQTALEQQNNEIRAGICCWKDGRNSAVALTFDDWSPGQYPLVVPALQKYGLVGTFFPILNNIERYDYSWAAIQKTLEQGNEIGNHTISHPDLTKLPIGELARETTEPQEVIREHVGTNVNTLAYPYGAGAGDTEDDKRVRDYLRAGGHIAARSVWRISNYGYSFANSEDDYYRIQMFALTEQTTTEEVCSEFDKIASGGGLLTLLYHSIDDEQNSYNDNWYAQVKLQSFCDQLAYLQKLKEQKKVWVTTFRNAILYHREANNATLKIKKSTKKYVDLSLQVTDTSLLHIVLQKDLIPISVVVFKSALDNYKSITQNGMELPIANQTDTYIMFDAIPNAGVIRLEK
ncbi:MAG: polysaccharide deacetylase family protein [Bacteroidales bacterium]|nr:polysaccharide deacetylase family protein [Bacteroidales bacterium]